MSSGADWPCAALRRASLADRTTMRVGGRIEWLLEPDHPDRLVAAWRMALDRGCAPRVLGGGANVIAADGDHAGVVIATARMARIFRPHRETAGVEALGAPGAGAPFDPALPRVDHFAGDPDPRLVAWAGVPLPGLVRAARNLGWSGLEGLVGVPGQVGGGVAMNAGGRWGELWDVIEAVRLLLPDGTVVHRTRAESAPRYRDGNLEGAVVLGAVVRLVPGDPAEIRERMKELLRAKSAAQPVTEHSSGCIFKNPDPELASGRSAGRLVEECGGKGRRRGDAVVSPKHANFIVNRGQATAADVLGLVDDVQRLVADRTGILLEREVVVWVASPPAARE
ncbi:MAG: FAD-binding protein [Planctomycetota bacterium]